VFAVYDKQNDSNQKQAIETAVDYPFESPAKGFERLLIEEIAESALRRFAAGLVESKPLCHQNRRRRRNGSRHARDRTVQRGLNSGGRSARLFCIADTNEN
jgi:hypothetical protein